MTKELASRAGPAPHPSREDTSRILRLLGSKKGGGFGGTFGRVGDTLSAWAGAGGSPLAKRLYVTWRLLLRRRR